MAASTQFARALLRHLYSEVTHGNSLLERLSQLNDSVAHSLESGKILQSTSGNGRSVAFLVNGSQGVTPTDMVELAGRLLDLYDAAVSAGNATDLSRFTWMMANLKPIRSYRSDFSNLLR